jgi:hypothetical protein
MLKRSYYSASLSEFLSADESSILGIIVGNNQHELELNQRNAWLSQIRILKDQLHAFITGYVFFEFAIPRMGKRADAVFLTNNAIFILEFKVGATSYLSGDLSQTVDYAVDLKNFHEGSHNADIVPILIATEASPFLNSCTFSTDRVSNCLRCNSSTIGSTINQALSFILPQSSLDPIEWVNSRYKPTPTIVQAAQALYRDHDVSEISRSDADAKNLSDTTEAIATIIEDAKAHHRKAICFITGVPGAGKTLAGLNITTSRMNHHQDEHAVFLSGNGPLVSVLRCALARDESQRLNITISDARRRSNTFIQNIHHFRDEYLQTPDAPTEKVVVFDEAQRAWDREQTSKFMRTKKGYPDFDASEPEFLIEVMDRHTDWCVIVALVGGGQEINSGEAGLPEWFDALRRRFTDWKVYVSDRIISKEYTNNQDIDSLTNGLEALSSESLHLGVSIRSFRAEELSNFVKHLIDNEPERAKACYERIRQRYPIFITRDLTTARAWLRQKKRGSELYGVITSSGAKRLRPEGLNVAAKIEPETWFLNGPEDVRSCQYLEEVATEFDIQGLELDWSVVGWDANLRRGHNSWHFYKFSGTQWQTIHNGMSQQYLLNAYRVLLTRARQGFVIYVPTGEPTDPTRSPSYYDPIYSYLLSCGIAPL